MTNIDSRKDSISFSGFARGPKLYHVFYKIIMVKDAYTGSIPHPKVQHTESQEVDVKNKRPTDLSSPRLRSSNV